jgi:hypothetical protein
MELVSVASARTVWLVNTVDLNPKGLRILPALTEALVDAYDFDEPPDEPVDPPNSIKLKEGMFEKDGEAYRVGLEIYNDGFVADSAHSTALTEEFLNHVIDWAKTNFEINFDPSLVLKKIYYSDVVVRFSSPLATACNAFAEFAQLLSRSIPTERDGYMLGSIVFSPRLPVGNNPPLIAIEHRANTPPDGNIFFCKAPLPTDDFLALLAKFDELLAHKS